MPAPRDRAATTGARPTGAGPRDAAATTRSATNRCSMRWASAKTAPRACQPSAAGATASIRRDPAACCRARPAQVVWQGGSTFERLYETFIGGRAALGIALLMAQVVGLALGQRSMAGVLLSAAYALQALLVWLLPRWRRDGQPRTPPDAQPVAADARRRSGGVCGAACCSNRPAPSTMRRCWCCRC